MATPLTTDWDGIQERNIDYRTPVDSDNHNKLMKIVGKMAYIRGLDISYELDSDNHRMLAKISPGVLVHNYMVIEFLQQAVIELFACPTTDRDILVVVEYSYRKILPRAYAVIKSIPVSEYNPEVHMRLYGYHVPTFNVCPTVAEWEEYIATHPGFVDYRVSSENVPAWATGLFVFKHGDTMRGPLFSFRDPLIQDEFANKHYVDYCISHHDNEHVDTFLQLTGGTLSGPLYLHTNPVDAMEAATKQYVDMGLATTNANFDNYYTKMQSDDRFVHKAGDVMAGYLTLSGDPVEPGHAATKAYVDLFVPRTGTTMTGYLSLVGDPTEASHAATKHYVDVIADDLHSNYYDKSTCDTKYVLVSRSDGNETLIENTSDNITMHVPAANRINFKVGDTISGRLTSSGFVGATYNADIAEGIVIDEDQKPQHGACLVYKYGKIVLSDKIGDSNVVGIVTYTPGILFAMDNDYDKEFKENKKVPLALGGVLENVTVYSKATIECPLVVSGENGMLYAISKDEYTEYIGCVVGKVLDIVHNGLNTVKIIVWRG